MPGHVDLGYRLETSQALDIVAVDDPAQPRARELCDCSKISGEYDTVVPEIEKSDFALRSLLMTVHPESASTAAIAFRDELLERGWPDEHQVAELASNVADLEAATYVIQARASGALLGVWSAPGHCFIYPDFQFNRSGSIRREVVELLAVLPGEGDRGGWRRTFWLYSPHALLEGRTPAEIFIADPTRVIAVAREEFLSDPEAVW